MSPSHECSPIQWTAWKVLVVGALDGAPEATRRMQYHTLGGFLMMSLGYVAHQSALTEGPLLFAALTAAGAIWMIFAFARFLDGLDERSRRLHQESLLFAISVLLVGGLTAGAWFVVEPFQANPIWIALIEPLRALGLYRAVRRAEEQGTAQ